MKQNLFYVHFECKQITEQNCQQALQANSPNPRINKPEYSESPNNM